MKKYEHVIYRIKDLIDSEVLKDGERLPSIRSMTKQMGFSNTTVIAAYSRLENLGLIEGHPQRGYYISHRANRMPRAKVQLAKRNNKSAVLEKSSSIIIPEDVQRFIAQALCKDFFPLGSSIPDPLFFPNKELAMHLSRIARDYPEIINSYDISMGQEVLKEVIARRMIEAGCLPNEDELVVTSTLNQALMLALRAVTRPGDLVAVESPGHNGFYLLLNFFNLNALEIPSDPQKGLSIEMFSAMLKKGERPACLLLSSNFSNPTGALMPDDNKSALAELCSFYNIPIIEDDEFGELTFAAYRPRPLKAFSGNNVIYLGSFSRILTPGYGIAWIAGGRYTDDIRHCCEMSAIPIPVAPQLALASYLKDGGLKKHLRRLRKQYKENVKMCQDNVKRFFPEGTKMCSPAGGQFLWVELPKGFDSVAVSQSSIKERITVAPGSIFSSRQLFRNNIRLNCALKWGTEVEEAFKRLGNLLMRNNLDTQ